MHTINVKRVDCEQNRTPLFVNLTLQMCTNEMGLLMYGDDDCEGEECEVGPIPSHSDLQSCFGTTRRYMESHSCVVSKYVGFLVQIGKYLQVVTR